MEKFTHIGNSSNDFFKQDERELNVNTVAERVHNFIEKDFAEQHQILYPDLFKAYPTENLTKLQNKNEHPDDDELMEISNLLQEK